MFVYALTAARRSGRRGVGDRPRPAQGHCLALVFLFLSMWLFNHVLTADTPPYVYFLPLVLRVLPLLPAVGSGTVARIEQGRRCWTAYRSTTSASSAPRSVSRW